MWPPKLAQRPAKAALRRSVSALCMTSCQGLSECLGEPWRPAGACDLAPWAELISKPPGTHPLASADHLRRDAFDSDEELAMFLALVTEPRHA